MESGPSRKNLGQSAASLCRVTGSLEMASWQGPVEPRIGPANSPTAISEAQADAISLTLGAINSGNTRSGGLRNYRC